MPSQLITRSLLIKGAVLTTGEETVLMAGLIQRRRSDESLPALGAGRPEVISY